MRRGATRDARRPIGAILLAALWLGLVAGGAGCHRPKPKLDVGHPLPDADAPSLLAALDGHDPKALAAALHRIEKAPDRRYVAPLIELLRYAQLGFGAEHGYNQRVITLEDLSGQSHGGDWFGWEEWYQSTDLPTPPGFATWKGKLFASLDPAFAKLLRDGEPTRIRMSELDWGGARFDGVPPLDHPKVVPAAKATFLDGGEPVLGLVVGDAARAYPLRILDWHEVVNDELDGVPVLVVDGPLAGSARAYDARLGGGPPLRFGSSGLVYRSSKLIFDRATHSLWSQLTGQALVGVRSKQHAALTPLPLVVTRWSDWKTRHPDTTVLSRDTGYKRPYQPGLPYGGYYESPSKLFPAWAPPSKLPVKERIYGLVVNGHAAAFTLARLVKAKVEDARVGGQGVVLLALSGRIVVKSSDAKKAGFYQYDAGGAVRSYLSAGVRFEPGPNGRTVLDQQGRPWRVTEDALIGPSDQHAPRVAGTLAYWFAWHSLHRKTALYR